MYIKKVKKTNGKTNKVYSYLHLVESIRTEQGPRQRLIINLGNPDLDPSYYPILAKRIEDLLTGQLSAYPIDAKVERYAKTAFNKITRKQSREQSAVKITDYQKVDVNSIKANNVRSYGPELLCHSIWNELSLDAVFLAGGVKKDSLSIIKALVLARLIEPGSELHIKSWAEERSGLYELCGRPVQSSLQSYYRATDTIWKLKDELEQHLSTTEKDLFGLDESVCLFDLTNTYFEGTCAENAKASYGHSKEKRGDCKLATMGMIVDPGGFPKYSRFFPGNQYEAATLETMIKELETHTTTKKKMIIIDAGIATEDNLKWLQEHGYTYIAVSRQRRFDKGDFGQLQTVREDQAKGSKIEIAVKQAEGETFIYCKSEYKRRKEEGMRTRVEQLFLDKLAYLNDGLIKKGRMKKYQKVVEAIGRLKEKYPKAAKHFRIEVEAQQAENKILDQVNAVKIIITRKDASADQEQQAEGVYILRTNEKGLEARQIWEYYILQGRIEMAFRNLKSHLGFRPNFHRTGSRVEAHMFISVLAYHILNTIEYKLKANCDSRSFETIRDILSTHQLITVEYNSKEEETEYRNVLRVTGESEDLQKQIYESLGISPHRFKRKIMKTEISSDEKKT
jgi:transposase